MQATNGDGDKLAKENKTDDQPMKTKKSLVSRLLSEPLSLLLVPFVLAFTYSMGDLTARLLYGWYTKDDIKSNLQQFVDPLNYKPPVIHSADATPKRSWLSMLFFWRSS